MVQGSLLVLSLPTESAAARTRAWRSVFEGLLVAFEKETAT